MSTADPDPTREPRRERDAPRTERGPTERPADADGRERPPSVPILGSDQPAAAWVRRSVDSSGHMAAGWQFAVTLVAFALGGWGLDRWLGTTPWLLILGSAAGFTGALYSLVKRIPLSSRPRAGRPPEV